MCGTTSLYRSYFFPLNEIRAQTRSRKKKWSYGATAFVDVGFLCITTYMVFSPQLMKNTSTHTHIVTYLHMVFTLYNLCASSLLPLPHQETRLSSSCAVAVKHFFAWTQSLITHHSPITYILLRKNIGNVSFGHLVEAAWRISLRDSAKSSKSWWESGNWASSTARTSLMEFT